MPEPIYLALKAIGNNKKKTGDVLAARFPEIPTTRVGELPGTLGVVSTET